MNGDAYGGPADEPAAGRAVDPADYGDPGAAVDGERRSLDGSVDDGAAGADGADIDLALSRLPRNDMGNGARLTARHGADIVYIDELGRHGTWLCWDGRRWEQAGGNRAVHVLCHDTVKALYGEVRAAIRAEPDMGRERRDKMYRYCVGSGNAGKVKAMLSEAAPYRQRLVEDLNCHPMLVTVNNGTLRLARRGDTQPGGDGGVALLAHRRGDLITRLAPVDYDPAAACPEFDAFIAQILPDAAVRVFLQTWFGYCLTGLIDAQMMVLFYGLGSNGKSVLLNILRAVLGDQAITTDFNALTEDGQRGAGDATPHIVRLIGRRLVTASEPKMGAVLSEATIKVQTGGEAMVVRPLFQDEFNFDPTHKLVLSFNNTPNIRAVDHGTWRRLALVPFAVTISDEDQDPDLPGRIIANEGPGILNWMLDGYRIYREQGLVRPDAVISATHEYRKDSDPIADFLDSWVEDKDGAVLKASDMRRAYELWCKGAARDPINTTWFGNLLREHGFAKRKSGTVSYLNKALSAVALETIDWAEGRAGGMNGVENG